MGYKCLNDVTPEEWDKLREYKPGAIYKVDEGGQSPFIVKKASETQVGGQHYQQFVIQPVEL